MSENQNIKLTTSEIAELWAQYMGDSMAKCVLKYFQKKVEDQEVLPVIDFALGLSESHINQITTIFTAENIPLPKGFTDEDVNLDAPRLYSDSFFLYYLMNMAKIGMASYSLSLANSARIDIRNHFTQSLHSSSALYNQTVEVMLQKGIFTRPPQVALTTEVNFVQKESFLGKLAGNQRSLLAMEVTHLFANMLTNIIGKPLLTGFGQSATSKSVRDYLMRGRDIASKHIEVFASTLGKDNIPAPLPSEAFVSDSTLPPFSDKLMMFHALSLNAAGAANYGVSASTSLRMDIVASYVRIAAEVSQFNKDGADILISNGWLEQPPQVIDHKKLNQ